MPFKEINPSSSSTIDIKKSPNEPFIGSYVGKKEIVTKIGPQIIWQYTSDDGEPFGIYGFTNLNRVMEAVPLGEMLRITYKGTQRLQTKFGMKDVHQVQVEAWEDGEEVKAAAAVLGATKVATKFDDRNPPPPSDEELKRYVRG